MDVPYSIELGMEDQIRIGVREPEMVAKYLVWSPDAQCQEFRGMTRTPQTPNSETPVAGVVQQLMITDSRKYNNLRAAAYDWAVQWCLEDMEAQLEAAVIGGGGGEGGSGGGGGEGGSGGIEE